MGNRVIGEQSNRGTESWGQSHGGAESWGAESWGAEARNTATVYRHQELRLRTAGKECVSKHRSSERCRTKVMKR